MSDLQSQGRFRLLLVDNASPFDATVRFFSRYISGGSKQREFLLGAVTSGKQRLFEFHDIPNGEEVTLHVQTLDNKEDQWTTTNSPTYITFTSSSLGQARYLVKGTKQEPELKFDGLVEDAIKTPMPPLQYHRQKTEQAENKGVPEPSSELKDKFRWMQCVIQNKTQFLIVHDPPAYFNSGRYDDPPKNVEPYDNMVFTVCNRDAAFTGATGGAAFRIILDGVAEYPFALGWTNPIVGAVTAGVTASSNAEDAYNISSEVGNAIKSTQEFSALDEDGKEVKFRFELTAAPGRKALYVVNQLRVR